MLKVISQRLTQSAFTNHLSNIKSASLYNQPRYLSKTIFYTFNKKHEQKKRNSLAPKVQPKDITDYMRGPQYMKKNILQVKNMQTSSEATLEENSLKSIIVEQRTLLQQSLREELMPEKTVEKQSLRSKILSNYMKKEELNKYYIKRPLKYLENIYFSLFVGNALGLTWLEYTNAYGSIGWFFGYFTAPAATSVLALLIGYNFAFWVVRHSFHLHVTLENIPQTKISMISTNWRNIAQLTFIASQFLTLAYYFSFGCPFAIYKLQLLLVSLNFGNLAVNLYQILKQTKIPFRSYLTEYMRIVSLSTLLILIFALYQIQVTAGGKPEDVFDNESYRSRVIEINGGYKEYINFFKKKKYLMKQNEKINPEDGD